MNFQILAFFLFLLFLQNGDTIYAENINSDLENSSNPIKPNRSLSDSKIHPLLIQWQLSDNPNEFAKETNISFTENKISVYIYLDTVESKSKIPQDISITALDEKIIVAFVSSEQLDKLEELDFVQRITPPDLARTPPIPQIEVPETQIPEKTSYNYLVWIVIGIITILIITKFKKRKSQKN